MKTKEEIIDWLRDAYAMEKAMEIALRKQMERPNVPASVRDQASLHLGETQRHAFAVADCLKGLVMTPPR